MKRSTLGAVALILLASFLTAAVLGFVLRKGMQSDAERQARENGVQVAEHRDANQRDHDCIVALALILGDPSRNRELPPSLPPECERAPAAHDHGG